MCSSVSLQYASHPTPGSGIPGNSHVPPLASISASDSSRFATLMVFTYGCARSIHGIKAPSIPGSPVSPVTMIQCSIGPSHLRNYHPNTYGRLLKPLLTPISSVFRNVPSARHHRDRHDSPGEGPLRQPLRRRSGADAPLGIPRGRRVRRLADGGGTIALHGRTG